MLDIILQILSILGTILLVLLIALLVILLLVLFFPITYRVYGEKYEDLSVNAKIRWLFGLLRVNYGYPQSGHLSVKVLWFTLFDKKIPGDKNEGDAKEDSGIQKDNPDSSKEAPSETPSSDMNSAETDSSRTDNGDSESGDAESGDAASSPSGTAENDESAAAKSFSEKILQKIEKIKYTFREIYDKIKKIWENISYYVQLLQDENTKQLFSHVCLRIGKILKSIRPRRIKADIRFGTGSPDTTGYAYGIYGMFCSKLGPKVIITPDFEEAIFEGNFDISGHITIWVILINALILLFDSKLHLFIEKMKAGKKSEASKTIERISE